MTFPQLIEFEFYQDRTLQNDSFSIEYDASALYGRVTAVIVAQVPFAGRCRPRAWGIHRVHPVGHPKWGPRGPVAATRWSIWVPGDRCGPVNCIGSPTVRDPWRRPTGTVSSSASRTGRCRRNPPVLPDRWRLIRCFWRGASHPTDRIWVCHPAGSKCRCRSVWPTHFMIEKVNYLMLNGLTWIDLPKPTPGKWERVKAMVSYCFYLRRRLSLNNFHAGDAVAFMQQLRLLPGSSASHLHKFAFIKNKEFPTCRWSTSWPINSAISISIEFK